MTTWGETVRGVVFGARTAIPRPTQMLVLAVILVEALLLPWRWYKQEQGASFRWISIDYLFSDYWTPDEKIKALYVGRAANTPCHADPRLCKQLDEAGFPDDPRLVHLYKRLTFQTFLSRTAAWYRHKVRYLPRLWFDLNASELTRHRTVLVEGLLVLLVGSAGLFWSARRWWQASEIAGAANFFGFCVVFVAFNIIVFTFVHFEARYSLPLRLFLLYSPLWTWCCLATPSAGAAPRRAAA